ncbi:MAG: NAD(P)/FAD-dependent oxidoreductase [Solirubrobacterales bacterium]
MRRVLVIGGSLAGLRTAEALRAEGYEGDLTILGDEDEPPYDRPPLSKEVLTGGCTARQVRLSQRQDLGATWRLGDAAIGLDPQARIVRTAGGEELRFDGLVIATGAEPRKLPVFGSVAAPLELRRLGDALLLRERLLGSSEVTIVGAGFIGVELASSARTLGLGVTLVSLEAPLAAAGAPVSEVITEELRDHGVAMHLGRGIAAARGATSVEALELDDGKVLATDLLVSAVGVKPATGWLRGSGLDGRLGVLCDARCRVAGLPGAVAVGDVARREDPRFGARRIEHWSHAVETARVAARSLIDKPEPANARPLVPSFWSEHFGRRLQSVGLPGIADRFELVEGSLAERRFVARGLRRGELVGAVAYGMPAGLVPVRRELSDISRLPRSKKTRALVDVRKGGDSAESMRRKVGMGRGSWESN